MSTYGLKFREAIKADPGYFLLEAVGDSEDRTVRMSKAPVIAWLLEGDLRVPYPVTLEGVQTDNVYILHPDGTVERPGLDGPLSVDEWLEELRRECLAKHGGKT